MADGSAIEWTDATWNPVRGCTKVSPGCKHCYAETFSERFRGVPGHPFQHGFDLRLVPTALELPIRWRASRRIFVNSMSDLFHDRVPEELRAPRVRRDSPGAAAPVPGIDEALDAHGRDCIAPEAVEERLDGCQRGERRLRIAH